MRALALYLLLYVLDYSLGIRPVSWDFKLGRHNHSTVRILPVHNANPAKLEKLNLAGKNEMFRHNYLYSLSIFTENGEA